MSDFRHARRRVSKYIGTACALALQMPALFAAGPSALPNLQAQEVAARVALGEKLFFDKRLSADKSTSCASCHQPSKAFTDGRALAIGLRGLVGTRNTPTVLNVRYNMSQFWDGRRQSLEEQALDPFLNEREHGLKDADALLALLRKDRAYVRGFRDAFRIGPAAIRPVHAGQAIAAFERTLVTTDSPFDLYYFKSDNSSLTPGAQRGLALFRGAAQCAHCHLIGETEATFTDNRFHSVGVGLHRISDRMGVLSTRLAVLAHDRRAMDKALSSNRDFSELGRFAVTLDPADIGKFRTPGLRNVALTAPYMHDGSIPTLKEAVEREIYYRGAAIGLPLSVTPQDKDDLVEFLHALTSPAAGSIAGR